MKVRSVRLIIRRQDTPQSEPFGEEFDLRWRPGNESTCGKVTRSDVAAISFDGDRHRYADLLSFSSEDVHDELDLLLSRMGEV